MSLALEPELLDQWAEQVLAFFPHVAKNKILVDLRKTHSLELTVNRIVDGQFLEGTYLDPSYDVILSNELSPPRSKQPEIRQEPGLELGPPIFSRSNTFPIDSHAPPAFSRSSSFSSLGNASRAIELDSPEKTSDFRARVAGRQLPAHTATDLPPGNIDDIETDTHELTDSDCEVIDLSQDTLSTGSALEQLDAGGSVVESIHPQPVIPPSLPDRRIKLDDPDDQTDDIEELIDLSQNSFSSYLETDQLHIDRSDELMSSLRKGRSSARRQIPSAQTRHHLIVSNSTDCSDEKRKTSSIGVKSASHSAAIINGGSQTSQQVIVTILSDTEDELETYRPPFRNLVNTFKQSKPILSAERKASHGQPKKHGSLSSSSSHNGITNFRSNQAENQNQSTVKTSSLPSLRNTEPPTHSKSMEDTHSSESPTVGSQSTSKRKKPSDKNTRCPRTEERNHEDHDKTTDQNEKPNAAPAKRAERQREKEERMKRKKEEGEARKAMRNVNTIRSKSDCVTEMIVEISCDFLSDEENALLLATLREAGAQASLMSLPISRCLRWSRKVTREWNAADECWEPCSEKIESEPFVLVRLTGDHFAEVLARANGCILPYNQTIRTALPDTKVIYLMEGLETYYKRKNRTKAAAKRANDEENDEQDSGRKRKRKPASDSTLPTPLQMEEQLLKLQLEEERNVYVHLSKSPKETIEWIGSFTDQISMIPELRHRSEQAWQLNFGDKIRSGADDANTWVKMLEQIQMCTEARAKAIVQVYPSLQSLYCAYERCTSATEARNLLAKIQVNSGTAANPNLRNIGPQLSKRVYAALMEEDASKVLME
ncbi:uncharacterized protein SPPG_00020 [Spizellomyces punctatus DAOM BR117]|uniref:CUE domain-containing protein n=1 Tax=Spizellomyces punctatus (strain DAOM BR117) TaxID=645134 RepID=A0A0L0HTU0_SPIPD|nr:uncharacterized protein SPPG_00020 [Spizellomyces punctatus DAOM BR117]KND04284.1 hypothetical protein SPPG_00020 [Spizellomyces punctatus DAOM BR117]|eukprot:XP_016612323.1 hypothetical protein SPPG_00020 [Spizellomyces punctatus DAOM BR117]